MEVPEGLPLEHAHSLKSFQLSCSGLGSRREVSHPVVFGAYSWPCTQGSLQAGPYVVPHMKPRLVVSKANALIPGLFKSLALVLILKC